MKPLNSKGKVLENVAIQLIKNQFFNLYTGYHTVKEFAAPEVLNGLSHLDIPDKGYIENWNPIIFLKKKGEGPLADMCQTNISGRRICAPKLKKIIEDNLTEDDNEIQWLPVRIKDEESEKTIEYYYLHFPEYCDVLDLERSTIDLVLGGYDKEIISHQKVKNRSIFNCPQNKRFTAISKNLKQTLFKSGCTGISVTPLTVIDDISEDKKVS